MSFFNALKQASSKEALSLLEQRFTQNLHFFEKHLPHLAKQLKKQTQQFNLFIDATGINIKSNDETLIYPLNNNKSTIFEVSKALTLNLGSTPTSSLYFNQNGLLDYQVDNLPIICKLVNSINQEVRQDPDYKEASIYQAGEKHLPTMTVYGLLSGLHIELLVEQYETIHALFIYEPNIDFFIISAFFVDYAALYNRVEEDSCFLFIGGFLSDSAVKSFFTSRLITNNHLRLDIQSYNDKRFTDAKALFLKQQRANTRGWGTVDDELFGLYNRNVNVDPKNIKTPVLTTPKKNSYPICIIGNGPSLEALLPFIKANQNNMILFSAGTALKPLRSAGIKPDFQIEIERRDHVAAVLENAPLDDIPLLCADLIHPSTLAVGKENYLFVRDATACTGMHNPHFKTTYASPVVGNAAVALALEFSDTLYLCGLDVGFKGDGKQHASNSFYDDREDKAVEKIPTRGNLSSNVYTNSLFSLSRELFEHAFARKKANVYNLSDGAFIKGATPTQAKSITLKEQAKDRAIQNIKNAHQTTNVFNNSDLDYNDELFIYLEEMHKLLQSQPITSKKSLYKIIDNAYFATTIIRKNEPVTGTLMSGTYWHILNAIFIGLMHIHRNDIDELYKTIVENLQKQLTHYLHSPFSSNRT